MVRNDMCSLWLEGHFRDDRIEGVGTVTISKNVKARKDEIFMPVTLPQGTIKEVHKAAGFEGEWILHCLLGLPTWEKEMNQTNRKHLNTLFSEILRPLLVTLQLRHCDRVRRSPQQLRNIILQCHSRPIHTRVNMGTATFPLGKSKRFTFTAPAQLGPQGWNIWFSSR